MQKYAYNDYFDQSRSSLIAGPYAFLFNYNEVLIQRSMETIILIQYCHFFKKEMLECITLTLNHRLFECSAENFLIGKRCI